MSNRRLYILIVALAFPLLAEDSDGARMRALIDAQDFAASLDRAAVIARETAAAGHTDDLAAAQAIEWSAEARILNGDVSPEIGTMLTRANEIIRRAAAGETFDLARNLTLQGKYAYADGKYAEATRELEHAAAILARLDAPPLDRVRTALALADAYRLLDRYPEAIALARETLARSEAAAGPESLYASLAHYSLGMALIRTEFSNAGSELEIARRLAEKVTGPESAFTGHVVVALGTVAVHQARFPDGNRLFEEALAIFAKSVPAGHPRYLALWNNYALALKQSGNYEGAQRAFNSALAIATARLGPEHTVTAQIYGNLGIVYSERGNYPEALRTYERALAIQEKQLGPDHYPVAGILNSMGQLHAALNDFAQADREFSRAIRIYEKTLGSTNGRTLSVRRARVGLLLDSGKSEEARALAVETLELTRHAAEPDAVEIAAIENGLGKALMRLHRYKEARVYLEEAAAGVTGHPADLQTIANAYSNLGELDADEGRFAEAVEWQRRVQSAYAAIPNSPYLANIHLREAHALAGAGKPADALEQALEAERRRQESVRIIAQGMAERLALLSTVQAEGGLALAMECMRTDADTRRVWDLEIRAAAT
jgi:tetratricopeptide (TPR) repeat protein